ncbi:unnamed protein product [Blepharisma stoltei]|uniref:Protein kinase domain-containing protein n=1 Tax=Blepharisma stoltei TaxID=1481888 RepID=A0AAU9IU48_9CILI|nr:unnamed protein product [Blepharisma stoltei]
MEDNRTSKLKQCREVLLNSLMKDSNQNYQLVSTLDSIRPDPLTIPRNSYYERWRLADKLFDGKFSSGHSTPCTPLTPALSIDKKLIFFQTPFPKAELTLSRMNSFELQIFKSKENLDYDLPTFKIDDSMYSPPLSHRNSILEDDLEVCRYEHDFIQLNILGSGNFGAVYKCLNKIDGLYYAVKQIKTNPRNKASRNEALQEAYALAQSSMCEDNTYIIRYYSVWIEKDYLYICMELCDCSLTRYVERNPPVTESLIRKIMRDICKGLKKLHAHNIIHMDIKSENILYSFSGKFKLADLGLARVTTNLTGEIPEGDARYLAPEVLANVSENPESIPDLSKADIFSLGATIYELMRGKTLPINGPEWHSIRNGDLDFKGDFSEELQFCVKKMMSKDLYERPSAAELLETILISEKEKEIRRLKDVIKGLEKQIEESNSRTAKRKCSV